MLPAAADGSSNKAYSVRIPLMQFCIEDTALNVRLRNCANRQTHSTDAGKGSNLKYRQNNKKLLHWINRFLDVPAAKAACFELDNSRLRSFSYLPATKKFSFTHSASHAQTRTILYTRISPSPPFQQSVCWSAVSAPHQLPSG